MIERSPAILPLWHIKSNNRGFFTDQIKQAHEFWQKLIRNHQSVLLAHRIESRSPHVICFRRIWRNFSDFLKVGANLVTVRFRSDITSLLIEKEIRRFFDQSEIDLINFDLKSLHVSKSDFIYIKKQVAAKNTRLHLTASNIAL